MMYDNARHTRHVIIVVLIPLRYVTQTVNLDSTDFFYSQYRHELLYD